MKKSIAREDQTRLLPINLKGVSPVKLYPRIPQRNTRIAFLEVPESQINLFTILCFVVLSSSSFGPIWTVATICGNKKFDEKVNTTRESFFFTASTAV